MKTNLCVVIFLLVILGITLLQEKTETFAGSPATITQLSANSGLDIIPNIRPVRQRGIYFGNPSWFR